MRLLIVVCLAGFVFSAGAIPRAPDNGGRMDFSDYGKPRGDRDDPLRNPPPPQRARSSSRVRTSLKPNDGMPIYSGKPIESQEISGRNRPVPVDDRAARNPNRKVSSVGGNKKVDNYVGGNGYGEAPKPKVNTQLPPGQLVPPNRAAPGPTGPSSKRDASATRTTKQTEQRHVGRSGESKLQAHDRSKIDLDHNSRQREFTNPWETPLMMPNHTGGAQSKLNRIGPYTTESGPESSVQLSPNQSRRNVPIVKAPYDNFGLNEHSHKVAPQNALPPQPVLHQIGKAPFDGRAKHAATTEYLDTNNRRDDDTNARPQHAQRRLSKSSRTAVKKLAEMDIQSKTYSNWDGADPGVPQLKREHTMNDDYLYNSIDHRKRTKNERRHRDERSDITDKTRTETADTKDNRRPRDPREERYGGQNKTERAERRPREQMEAPAPQLKRHSTAGMEDAVNLRKVNRKNSWNKKHGSGETPLKPEATPLPNESGYGKESPALTSKLPRHLRYDNEGKPLAPKPPHDHGHSKEVYKKRDLSRKKHPDQHNGSKYSLNEKTARPRDKKSTRPLDEHALRNWKEDDIIPAPLPSIRRVQTAPDEIQPTPSTKRKKPTKPTEVNIVDKPALYRSSTAPNGKSAPADVYRYRGYSSQKNGMKGKSVPSQHVEEHNRELVELPPFYKLRAMPKELAEQCQHCPKCVPNVKCKTCGRSNLIGKGTDGFIYKVNYYDNKAKQNFELAAKSVWLNKPPKGQDPTTISEERMHKISMANEERTRFDIEVMLSIDSPYVAKVEKSKIFKLVKNEPTGKEYHLVYLMDLAQNGDGATVIRHMHKVLSRPDAYPYLEFYVGLAAYQVGKGLKVMHARKLVHHDMKWNNTLLLLNFIITDFGMSNELRRNMANQSTAGTLKTLAPEVLLKRIYDNRADIWSLAIMIFDGLTYGHSPFKADKRQLAQEIMEKLIMNTYHAIDLDKHEFSPSARALLRQALAPIEQRFSNMDLMLGHFFFRFISTIVITEQNTPWRDFLKCDAAELKRRAHVLGFQPN